MAKRRPNGSGSITRRADGTYEARTYVTTTEGLRKRVSAYGKTYDEADEKLSKLKEQESKGVPTPDKAWTVADFLNYWLEQVIRPNLRFNTTSKYEIMIRLYLIPRLGKKKLVKLSVKDIRVFLAQLRHDEVGDSTRQECMKVLRNALNAAMREELLLRNVAVLVGIPSAESKEIIPWSAEEAIGFLRSARPHRLYAAFVLALVLGLRRGELLGLRWIDLDIGQGVAHPRKQVQRKTGVGLVHVDLKTDSSKAALPLPLLCVEALGERRRLQELERARAGMDWSELDLVFSTETGGLLDPDHFSQTFQRRVKRSKLRRVRLHDTRHTCGSLLAWLGVHPSDAQKILRHSQITTTLEIYTHVTTETQRAAAAKVSAKLRDGLNGR
ncbi:tyrosine-type recombinase/integrase [Streptacidiphilus fuscans]|uniref:Site-specific integrase n=1 Tax=Streptacidiphilus fuscans TaxID=2789292 RepID=A0A931B776_9ACTN|nr:site-specific integrase [Streptacidiphilus fuscans]MBF9068175.1 site-specific integrase [Streptacidiphilus fuscans]